MRGARRNSCASSAAVADEIKKALATYREEVEHGSFPTRDHCYKIEGEEELLDKLY